MGEQRTLADASLADIGHALRTDGLILDLGVFRARVRTPMHRLAGLLQRVYPDLPWVDPQGWADTSLAVLDQRRPWAFWSRSTRFLADGIEPFPALPGDMALPQLEWGMNWCFANMFNQHLLLHAGTVEIGRTGMLMIAQPGSGKSTLTAALGLRGARVLSDEFGVLRMTDARLLALVKPIALKNRSIEVISRWSPQARFGPTYFKTHKGDVSHLALGAYSTQQRSQPARPRVLLFPRWQAGARLSIEPVSASQAFADLAVNSFNFDATGRAGFDALVHLVRECQAFSLVYEHLEEAVPALEALCRQNEA